MGFRREKCTGHRPPDMGEGELRVPISLTLGSAGCLCSMTFQGTVLCRLGKSLFSERAMASSRAHGDGHLAWQFHFTSSEGHSAPTHLNGILQPHPHLPSARRGDGRGHARSDRAGEAKVSCSASGSCYRWASGCSCWVCTSDVPFGVQHRGKWAWGRCTL